MAQETPGPAPLLVEEGAAPDSPESKEAKEIKNFVTPERTRLALGGKYLNPEEKTISPDDADALKSKKAEEIDYKAVSKLSKESRDKYWEAKKAEAGGPQTFTEQNKDWNEGTWGWMKKPVDDEAVMEHKKAALKSLDIDLDAEGVEQEADGLNKAVEKFRNKYFTNGSNVKEFVADIASAADLKEGDGTVKLKELEERLKAVSELFKAFGEDLSSNELIQDYAMTHGLLSQNQEAKDQLPGLASTKFDLPEKKKPIFKALFEKHNEAVEEKKFQDNIKDRLEKARGEAEHTDKIGEAHEMESAAQDAYRKGEIDKDELKKRVDQIRAQEKGIVEFNSPEEFAEALRQLSETGDYTYEAMKQTYYHEMAHHEKALAYAKQHSLKEPIFRIQVSKDNAGKPLYHPSVDFTLPPDDELAKKIQDEILSAPGFDDLDSVRSVSEHDLSALGVTKEDVEAAKADGAKEIPAILDAARKHAKNRQEPPAETQPPEPETDANIAAKASEVLSKKFTIHDQDELKKRVDELSEKLTNEGAEKDKKESALIALYDEARQDKGASFETLEELSNVLRALRVDVHDEEVAEILRERKKEYIDKKAATGGEQAYKLVVSESENEQGKIVNGWGIEIVPKNPEQQPPPEQA